MSRITDRHLRAMRRQVAGDLAGAVQLWLTVLERRPTDEKALYFLALAFYGLKQLPRAIDHMRACLTLCPDHADAWYNLGKFYQDAGEPDQALRHYIAALELRPTFTEAYVNAGNLFLQGGDEDAAMGCWHMALAQNPTSPEAIYNRSFLKLLHGDYAGGFQDYEARWRSPAFTAEYLRPFMRSIPMWDGGALAGRRILLHAEQGIGDAIQYLRYAHADTFAGGVLEVHAPLVRLAQASFPSLEVIARDSAIPPDVRVQCPLLSLPTRFGTVSEATIPATVPYLTTPSTVTVDRGAGLNVALVWAGSTGHPNDADRSTTLPQLAPLFHVPDVTWHSLQIGERADEADGYPLARTDRLIRDFADTAAVLQQLDLLITVDTATAHLGGALGVPTWCMVPANPEHRWLLKREDTPWYPTMTLWRRTRSEAWGEMASRMAEALRTCRMTPPRSPAGSSPAPAATGG